MMRHGGLHLLLSILKLDGTALGDSDNTKATARRSLGLWLVILPCFVVASYIAERPYIALKSIPAADYAGMRLVTGAVGLSLAWLLVWQAVKFESLEDNFPRLFTAQNWLTTFWAVLAALSNFSTRNMIFLREDIIRLMTVEYLVWLLSIWFVCWRTLKCNPFYAAGVATLLLMPQAAVSDIASHFMFGTARPFFDPAMNILEAK